jgi:hypothetical protein
MLFLKGATPPSPQLEALFLIIAAVLYLAILTGVAFIGEG